MYVCPFLNISPYYYISNNKPNIHNKTLSVSIRIDKIYLQFFFSYLHRKIAVTLPMIECGKFKYAKTTR